MNSRVRSAELGTRFGRFVGAMLLLATSGLAQDKAAWIGSNRRLEAELALAKSPAVYLLVQTEARTAELRIRGMSLKKWKLARLRIWGSPPRIEPLKVIHRTGWTAEERINFTPGKEIKKENKSKNIGDDVLEIEDMPSRYSFLMENKVRINIRPRASGIFGRVGSVGTGLFRSISMPLKSLWMFVLDKEFTSIFIKTETKKDAQEIFWSIPEGSKIIIQNF